MSPVPCLEALPVVMLQMVLLAVEVTDGVASSGGVVIFKKKKKSVIQTFQ